MDLVEQIAAKLHEGWMQHKQSAGFTPGPERTDTTHPHLVDWTELNDIEAQNQDRFQAALILHAYSQQNITHENLPAMIHNFWVVWEQVHGVSHRHAQAYEEAHPNGADEHAIQADLIWPILQAIES